MRRRPEPFIECHGGREVPGGQRYLVQIHREPPVQMLYNAPGGASVPRSGASHPL